MNLLRPCDLMVKIESKISLFIFFQAKNRGKPGVTSTTNAGSCWQIIDLSTAGFAQTSPEKKGKGGFKPSPPP